MQRQQTSGAGKRVGQQVFIKPNERTLSRVKTQTVRKPKVKTEHKIRLVRQMIPEHRRRADFISCVLGFVHVVDVQIFVEKLYQDHKRRIVLKQIYKRALLHCNQSKK